KPSLKVMLSIGGWGSGRFSEMVACDTHRESFARDCRRVVEEFGLDGIDIDWEYPTNQGPGISYAPEDTRNFTLLMRDVRTHLPN
ncbi:MAG TPA: glycosyl hydrolase family 18, partial [Rikenellaceae bacterium]|nr:glycosyl hydrolase family 18 [Rikenellaceae bacterium]